MTPPAAGGKSTARPLSWRQWTVVLVAVVVTLPVVGYMAVPWQVETFLFRNLRLPHYERLLGFRVGELRDSGSVSARAAPTGPFFGLVAVEPGGVFDRLGFRAGDRMVWHPHGFEDGFYSDLRYACREPVKIRVLNVGDAQGPPSVRAIRLAPADLPRELCP